MHTTSLYFYVGDYCFSHSRQQRSNYFFIHESMDIVNREQIQNHLLKANGIVSVEFDHFRLHLLCVEYIPTLIQSSLITSHLPIRMGRR